MNLMITEQKINETIVSITALALFLIFALIYRKFHKNNPKITNSTNRPLILAYYTKNKTIRLIDQGVASDMPYSLFSTDDIIDNKPMPYFDSKLRNKKINTPNVLVYLLDLPFNTNAHIVGVSKNSGIDNAMFNNYLDLSDMEPAQLEGNFNDSFSLYAKRGQGPTNQYIFDPAAMEFVIDYCKNNFWEITNNKMYIACDSDKSGNMLFIKDSLEFVRQIQPATAKQNNLSS